MCMAGFRGCVVCGGLGKLEIPGMGWGEGLRLTCDVFFFRARPHKNKCEAILNPEYDGRPAPTASGCANCTNEE